MTVVRPGQRSGPRAGRQRHHWRPRLDLPIVSAVGHLTGKVVLVTGAAGGFGELIATQAATRGAIAVALDIDASGAAKVAAAIEAEGGRALGLGLDVRDRQAFAAAAAQVVSTYGRLDVLVNNAGVMPLAFLADHARAADVWDRTIDINLKGVCPARHLCRTRSDGRVRRPHREHLLGVRQRRGGRGGGLRCHQGRGRDALERPAGREPGQDQGDRGAPQWCSRHEPRRLDRGWGGGDSPGGAQRAPVAGAHHPDGRGPAHGRAARSRPRAVLVTDARRGRRGNRQHHRPATRRGSRRRHPALNR
ncbi:hypothetical protein FAIPA1_10377 [Frankia sp. AiPs1]